MTEYESRISQQHHRENLAITVEHIPITPSQQPEGPCKLAITEATSSPAPVDFRAPVPLARPKTRRSLSYGLTLGASTYGQSIEEDVTFCARSCRNHTAATFLHVDSHGTLSAIKTHAEKKNKQPQDTNTSTPYIIVGMIDKEGSVPRETLVEITNRGDLFRQIHTAEKRLRSPIRRLLSLKRVAAFGLYQCHPQHDYHTVPEVSTQTQRCLLELYRNYTSSRHDHKDRWLTWVHSNFNNDSYLPERGVYALQLRMHWSPVKLMVWSGGPLVLSLVIGFWYMLMSNPAENQVAVVQTAWTVASYIVTTAALALAIVASITQLGDVQ